ncbi:MAG: hypothetical protein KKF44_03880 [Nanoarchaeota archaeon]|nr:hypothetical protein [Nanoarchaeota archaeon]
MKQKRGLIEIQFNWIFVLVVGAIMVLLFFVVGSRIKNNFKATMELDATSYLEEIFVNLQLNENSEHTIDLPSMQLEFSNEIDNCNYFGAANSDLEGKSIEYIPVFSPDLMEDRILSYSQRWDFPFTASYFLYITSPEMAYVIDEASFGFDINSILPEHLNTHDVGSFDPQISNYFKIRFVYADSNPESIVLHPSVAKMHDNKVTALNIVSDTNTVEYFRKNQDKFEYTGFSHFFDETTLLAAIYSESDSLYECNLNKAIKRLNQISNILIIRYGLIKDKLPGICSGSPNYEISYGLLIELANLTESPVSDSLPVIERIKTELVYASNEIIKEGCPTIY